MPINMPGSRSPAEQPTAPYTPPDPTTGERAGPYEWNYEGSASTPATGEFHSTGLNLALLADAEEQNAAYFYSRDGVAAQFENENALQAAVELRCYTNGGILLRGYDANAERVRITQSGDVVSMQATRGMVLRSPNGNYWRATISDAGVVTWTNIGAVPV